MTVGPFFKTTFFGVRANSAQHWVNVVISTYFRQMLPTEKKPHRVRVSESSKPD
jgi:hypothetical protein